MKYKLCKFCGREYEPSWRSQKYCKKCRKRAYREHKRKYMKKYNQKMQERLRELLGVNCVICGKERINFQEFRCGFVFHEIHGKSHIDTYSYILNHLQDFVLLCWRCHRFIHYFARSDKKNIEELLRLLRVIL